MRRLGLVPLLLAAAAASSSVAASRGDNDPAYRACVAACSAAACSTAATTTSLPLALRLTWWSCPDNCSYTCMHDISNARIAAGLPVWQYHGKWPFLRFLGIQEPASVLFSILNGHAHYAHRRAIAALPRDHPFRLLLSIYILMAINAWLWSSVFHTRDKPWTEKADYFSAAALILYSLALAICRVAWITRRRAQLAVVAALVPFYLLHVAYLSLYRFDYGYNMAASVAVGMLHNLVWIVWAWRARRSRRDWWMPLAFVLALLLASSLELFDFPPLLGILDAHSLWHAATVPIAWGWYIFILNDARIVYASTTHGSAASALLPASQKTNVD